MTHSNHHFIFFLLTTVVVASLFASCSDNGSSGQATTTIEITSISPDSGAVGSLVQISSDYIDPEHANNQVELNGMAVPILSYGAGSLQFRVPEGATSGPVTLTVGGKVANGPYFKVLTEGPAIAAISPASGGPGTQVTITGEHFLPPSAMAKVTGDSTTQETTLAPHDSLQANEANMILKAKGEPTSSINGLPVSVAFGDQLAPLLSLSSTEIIAEVPEGATGGIITVTVGDQTVTSSSFQLMRGAIISEVSPTTGPAGSEVTISGHYFSAEPDSNRVTFNGTPAIITQADSTQLVATVPNKATTGPIEVTTKGQTTDGPTFSVTETPVPQVTIEDISPKSGPVGTSVTITGENFSTTASENIVTFNGTEAAITSATETILKVSVPQGATNGPVKVSVGSQTATGPSFSVIADPDKQLAITGISPKQGPVGTSVSISGANFSATATDNTVTFNGTEAAVTSASTTELTVTVPQGATTGNITVRVGEQTATGPTFTVTEEPVPQVTIEEITPKEGPVGTTVTITGENFSTTASENIITFNGTEASISSASTTKLTVSVPQGATTGAVKVAVGSQSAEGPTFTVTEEPVSQVTIEDITPKEGPVGTQVTITGQNFSGTQSENTVTFNGTEATISNATETTLEVSVPQGATSGPVKVAVGNQTATGPSFSITADPDKQLMIEDITPKEGPVATNVTISGANFSATASENVVTFNGTQATVSNASTTQLVATVPNGATSGPVQVSVGSQTATGPNFTITANAAPTITGEGSFEIEENTIVVGTITASDPDGDDLTFSLSGGADQEQFSIDEGSGKLTFTTTPDFDNPVDENADNSYELEGKVTDGSVSVTKTITVSVTNVDEAPIFSGTTTITADENDTQIGTLDATDPEGQTLAFTLTGGADEGELTLDQNSGKLTFNTAPNFESPGDANNDNSYEAEVTISDGSLSVMKVLDITVQNVNEAPVITSAGPFEIQENNAAVGTITASDPDGDALDFALLGGTKGTLTFSIDNDSGEITISPAPDFETPRDDNSDNTYEVDINVNDGAIGTSQTVSITVTNAVEVPAINRGTISLSNSQNYSLNETTEENVYRFDPVPAGTDLSSIQQFSIATSLSADLATSATVTGGADGGLFSVNSINTYAIHIDGPSSLDYNHSADGNAHEYRFSVTATNAAGTTPTYTIIIPVQNPFAGGSGTESDPYQVETLEQLQAVGQYLDAHFVQTADIEASATASWNGGAGFAPIGDYDNRFSGTYDGYGHVITNLTINRTTTKYVGLFGDVGDAGAIKNVHTANGNITGSGIFGSGIGGLVGINRGTITGCSTGGTISASNTNSNVGGLVGYSTGAESNSYSTGSVDGAASGGLVGKKSDGTIETSYATGAVSGANFPGGLVGFNSSSVTITDSYWNTESTGQSTSAGGTGLTTSQMQGSAAQTNMTGFDFGSIWQTNAGDYPTLRNNP